MSQQPPYDQGPPQPMQPDYANQPGAYVPPVSEAGNKKLAAGLCAIFLGALGIHKFVLGYTTAGVITLLITLLTCGFGGIVMNIIGIIEGIIYLTKNDADFHQIYMANRREWF